MSIFSKLKASKKAAKEHKLAAKEKDPNEVTKIPYKHIPSHAAVDALSGAPSSWTRDDRSKIKEHHQRRSQMVISRTGSQLSTTSYMNAAAGPSSQAPPLPRNSSYSSYNPTWYDRSGDLYHEKDSRQARYKPQRGHSYHDSGIGPSPLASNVQSEGTSSASLSALQFPFSNGLTSDTEVSPVVSSGNSTNSNSSDHLEIAQSSTPKHQSGRPQPMVYVEQDIFDRLHTSTTRKLGEAPLYDSPPPPRVKPVAAVAAQEQKPKKQRWSLLGKKNTAVVV